MTRIFYFSGRAGDLPAALLRHETTELAKINKALGYKLAKPLHTISRLVAAAKRNGDTPQGRAARSADIRSIITNGN